MIEAWKWDRPVDLDRASIASNNERETRVSGVGNVTFVESSIVIHSDFGTMLEKGGNAFMFWSRILYQLF